MLEIRSKLKSGVSIHDVCREYNLTFKELMEKSRHYDNPIKGPGKGKDYVELYIRKRGKSFILIKNSVWYGGYNSLSDARKVKEYFMANGWDKRNIGKACSIVGVERCK